MLKAGNNDFISYSSSYEQYDMKNPFQNHTFRQPTNYPNRQQNQIQKNYQTSIMNQEQVLFQNIVLQKMRRQLKQGSKQYDYINSNNNVNSLELHQEISDGNFAYLLNSGQFSLSNLSAKLERNQTLTQSQMSSPYRYKTLLNNSPFQKQSQAKKNYYQQKLNKNLNSNRNYSNSYQPQSYYQQPIKLNRQIFNPQSIEAQRKMRNILHQQNLLQFKQLKRKQNIKKKLQAEELFKQKLKLRELKQNFMKLRKIQSSNYYQKNTNNNNTNVFLQESKSSRESESMLFNLSSSRRKLQSLFSFGMDGKGNSDFLLQESLRKRQVDFDQFDDIQGKRYPKTIMHRKKKFELIKFSNT